MPQYVYISAVEDGGPEDMQFFDSARYLYLDYEGHNLVRKLTQHEFIEAIEETEMVEENGRFWYRDTVLSLEFGK